MKNVSNKKRGRENDYRQVEKSTCLEFLELYNKRIGKNIKFERFGNPNLGKGEPDCICSDGLNIEVTTVFYDNEDAKYTWGLIDLLKKRISKDRYEKKYPDNTLGMNNPNLGLYDSLNKIIVEKNKKEYHYDGKLFLLIYSRPAISDEKDIEYYIREYRNFKNIIFDEVWLLLSKDHHMVFQLAKRNDDFLSEKARKINFDRINK